MRRLWTPMPPGAGLITGPFAWAVSTQLNFALVPWVCHTGNRLAIPVIVLVLTLISLTGALASRQLQEPTGDPPGPDRPEAGMPLQMLAIVGTISGVLFAVIIALQGVAGFFLTGCEP